MDEMDGLFGQALSKGTKSAKGKGTSVSLVCLSGPNRTSADFLRLTHCRMGPSMKASTWLEQDSEEEEAIVVVVAMNQQGANRMDDPMVFSSVLPLFL